MKKGLLILLVLLAGGEIAFAGGKQDGGAGQPLRVAVQSFYCSSPVGLIQKEGWAEEAGLNVEYLVFNGGQVINEAMGEWDIAVTGGAFVYAMANYDCKLIAHQVDGTDGNYVIARRGDPIINIKDDKAAMANAVRGKTLLTVFGTTSHYLLNLWLQSIGVRPEECNIVNLEFANVYPSWIAGQGDYCVLTAPYSYYDMDEMNSTIIGSIESTGGALYESTVCTRNAYENRYDEVVKFTELLYRACDMLAKDQAMAFQVAWDWYIDNGKTFKEEEVLAELKGKPFIGSAQAKTITLGNFAMDYARWFESRELIDPRGLQNVQKNIADDVFKAALSRF
jgi:ABC-type nitrate/sulfonate/bicarbonate transport system substrate-binding protein